jgi:AraC family transcriptional regulator
MQAQVLRPDSDGNMQFSTRASSDGRRWDGIEASIFDISPGVSERPPRSDYVIALHLSAAVEGTCRCDGATVKRTIKPGDIDFVPLGYAATWHDKGAGRIANVRLSPTLMRSTAAAMGYHAVEIAFSARLSLNDPVLRHLTLAIAAELEGGENGALFAESMGTAIATHLLRQYAHVVPLTGPRGLSRRQLSRILNYIEANLAWDPSLSDIAAVAGISASHLKALFKRSQGVPVHQYVIRRRVAYAARLLSRKGTRLCDVAQQAGFSDQSHMARCMRRIIGTTPAALLRDLHR